MVDPKAAWRPKKQRLAATPLAPLANGFCAALRIFGISLTLDRFHHPFRERLSILLHVLPATRKCPPTVL